MGGAARLRASKGRPRARGCGAAAAGWAGAGRQVSAASAFGGDGAAPSSCGRPLALAPRPRPPPPPGPPAAAAGRAGPGPAGRAAAARCAVVALGRPRRGELGAARGRARGPVSPRPLAPQRAGPGQGLRPRPGLRRQAGQQHAPGERAPGPGAAGTVRCPLRPPRTGHLRRGDPGRGPEAAAGGVRPGRAPGRGCVSSQGRPAEPPRRSFSQVVKTSERGGFPSVNSRRGALCSQKSWAAQDPRCVPPVGAFRVGRGRSELPAPLLGERVCLHRQRTKPGNGRTVSVSSL